MTEPRRLLYALESLPDLLGPNDVALIYEAIGYRKSRSPFPADEGIELRKHLVDMIRDRKQREEQQQNYSVPAIPEVVGYRAFIGAVCGHIISDTKEGAEKIHIGSEPVEPVFIIKGVKWSV